MECAFIWEPLCWRRLVYPWCTQGKCKISTHTFVRRQFLHAIQMHTLDKRMTGSLLMEQPCNLLNDLFPSYTSKKNPIILVQLLYSFNAVRAPWCDGWQFQGFLRRQWLSVYWKRHLRLSFILWSGYQLMRHRLIAVHFVNAQYKVSLHLI